MTKIERQIINKKRQAWQKEKKAEFKTLFPDVVELDEDGNELESFSEAFGSWLNELETYKIDEENYSRKVRPMPNFTASQEEIDIIYKLSDEYKNQQLQSLEITSLDNGLRFHTDDKSLIDLMIADREAERLGATNEDMTDWKTLDGIKQVSFKDIRDAIAKRLSNKAKIVGVV